MKELKIYNYKRIEGYLMKDIKKALSKKEFEDFEEFIYGQTCMRIKDEDDDLIYKWDFDRWMAGGPAMIF